MSISGSVLSADDGLSLDLTKIREDFPILSREVHGKPLVYLDNAASAQKPRAVIDAIRFAHENEYANVHRGLHFLSNAVTQKYEDAREKVRAFLNAQSTDEIIYTRNASEAINLVAQSFGGTRIQQGDEIVLTIAEHHSNIVPWHFHRERVGATIKWVDVSDQGEFDLDDFDKAITDKTKMVAITHMSNVLGTILPVKDIVSLAHSKGVPVLLDGSQAAVHAHIDVQDLDCDFYVLTGHKLYGPSGIGVLYGKRDLLASMPPFNGGGEMIKDVTLDGVTYAEPPHRFEAGTPPIVEAIALGTAIDYVNDLGMRAIADHEAELTRYAMSKLGEIEGIKFYGTSQAKSSVIAFNIEGAHPHDVSTVIDRYGVAVRAGTHCAQPLLTRFNTTATCRASLAVYNTHDDIDKLVDSLNKARSFFT